jgi:FkbM family methyltransferase
LNTFVDVGANRGDWAAAILNVSPNARGVIYEPGRVALDKLRKRYAGNAQVLIREAGCGSLSERLQFYEGPDGSEHSSFVYGGAASSFAIREVDVVRLDQDLPALGFPEVDFLKIDAEGLDFEVLAGSVGMLARQSIRLIQFEYGGGWRLAGATLLAAWRLLESHGYEIYLIRVDGLWRFDPEVVGEYYAYSNFLACAPCCKSTIEGVIRGRFAG